MKTILTVKEICDRWGVDARTISRYEDDGIIRRISGMPGVKYSLASIEKIEYGGTDNLIMKKVEKKLLEVEVHISNGRYEQNKREEEK